MMPEIEPAVGGCMRRKVTERELLEVDLHCKSRLATSTIGTMWPGAHIGMKKRHKLLVTIEVSSLKNLPLSLSLIKKKGGKWNSKVAGILLSQMGWTLFIYSH